MSVKVHEAFSIDSFQDRLLWWDDFLGDQLKDEWAEAGVGSAATVDAQTGGIVRLTTGAASGDAYTIDWGVIRSLHVSKKLSMEIRLKQSSTTAIQIIPQLRFDASNRIRTYNTGGNWIINCINGGASTAFDSGVASDTNWHIFRIECFPTDEVHFYIDADETGGSPITTNIPDDAGDFLQPLIYIQTTEDVAKSLDVDYVVVRQEI